MNATTNPSPITTQDDRLWGTLVHLSALLNLVMGLGGLIAALIVWLVFRDRSAYVEREARESLNFQISFVIYGLAAGLLVMVVIGLLLLPIVGIAMVILCILAAVKANEGVGYRYPFIFRLVPAPAGVPVTGSMPPPPPPPQQPGSPV